MKRTELEHVIRAAGAIAQSKEVVVIESQAILGMYPEPPADLVVSQEADIYPIDDPSKSDLIDGALENYPPFMSNSVIMLTALRRKPPYFPTVGEPELFVFKTTIRVG